MIAIGIVNEGYDTSRMPGWENGTVGYQMETYMMLKIKLMADQPKVSG